MLTRASRLLAARGAQPWCGACRRALATQAPRDPYAVLGVSRGASLEEVKAAYRREALAWHPDRHPESEREVASARFKAVSEAYQTLSDASSRSRHDSRASYEQAQRGEPGWGRDTARAGGASAGGRAWSDARQGGPGPGFTEADAERLFREVFGSAGGLAELLRKMQAAQGAAGRSRGGGWEEALGQAMRSAAAGVRTEVESSVHVRADGERVLRTVTTTIGRDGRATQHVEERSLGRTTRASGRSGRAAHAEAAAAEEAAPDQAVGTVRGALRLYGRALLGAVLGAVGPAAARAVAGAATRAAAAFAGAALRAVLRRVLGGR